LRSSASSPPSRASTGSSLGVRILGFNWFGVLGDLPRFEQAAIWGWLALIAGVAWIVAAFGLWSLLKWAWMFALIVAGLALLGACIWFLEYPGTGVGFSAAIMPLLIIMHLNSANVESQFHDAPEEEL
jgi:cytochrome c oxidase subunit IV